MNPYQIIGILVGCTLCFAGVVAGLSYMGVPLLVAFLGVYFSTAWFMLGLQRRALQASDNEYASSRKQAGTDTHNPDTRRLDTESKEAASSQYAIQPHTLAQFDRLYVSQGNRSMDQMSFEPIADSR